MNEYIEQALRTKSDKFYGERVPLVDFRLAVGEAINALRALDDMKKAIFYGKPYDGRRDEYKPNVNNIREDVEADTLHAVLGIATEAGELLEHLQAVTNGACVFDEVNFIEEVGDIMWYQAIGLNMVKTTFDDCQATNIAKLKARFPDRFSEASALTRDLPTERKVLEG